MSGLDLLDYVNTQSGVLGSIYIWVLILAWALVWKGLALWKSARRSDKAWFVALLIINTVGILEILYIYVFSKRSKNN